MTYNYGTKKALQRCDFVEERSWIAMSKTARLPKLTELDNAARDKTLELWLRCFTQEQIAEELSRLGYGEYSQQTISRVIGNHTQNGKIAEMSKPSELKLYTVWNFPKLSEDQLRYPGQLPEALLT